MSRQWYYAGIAIVLLSLLIHQPLLLLLGLLVLFILVTADIWAKYCMRDVRYAREFSEKRVLFGEEITLAVSLENAKLLPLPWLEIEETVPRALTYSGRSLRISLSSNSVVLESLFSLRWYERVTRRYTVLCTARGVHAFGPTTLRSGDVYGFQSRQQSVTSRQYMLVYPLVVPLTRFGLPARHPFGDYKTPRRLLEDPSRVIGVREYMYGDDLRRVHWKATARMMQLQSKVYQPTTTYTLVIFLNAVSQLDVWYGIHPELQELAICAAASIANWALDEGLAVGLYANTTMYIPELGMSLPTHTDGTGETRGTKGTITNPAELETMVAEQLKRRRISLPPASNEEQRKRIMEALARIQAYFGSSIEDLLQHERTRLPAGATVVLITSTISDPLLDTVARVRHAGHAVTILLVSDRPISVKLAGVTVYHLGGEDAWNALLEGAIQKASTGETGEQLDAINRAPTGSFTF